MQYGSYELEVLVHGKPVREHQHQGKNYIEGKKGSEFTLRFHNRSSERALAVLSVDGLSIMDGKDCSFDSGGYVIDPYSSVNIPGWRLDMENVAKFFFSGAKGESYAGSQSKHRNIGVIGCAVFRGKPLEIKTSITFTSSFPSFPPGCRGAGMKGTGGNVDADLARSTCDSGPAPEGVYSMNLCSEDGGVQCNASPACGAAPAYHEDSVRSYPTRQLMSQQLGTGFGSQSGHRVEATSFERLETPDYVFEIHYDSREALIGRGVDLAAKPAIVVPCPFPGNPSFCRPPAGWTGKS